MFPFPHNFACVSKVVNFSSKISISLVFLPPHIRRLTIVKEFPMFSQCFPKLFQRFSISCFVLVFFTHSQ